MPLDANLDASVAMAKGTFGSGTRSTGCLRKRAFRSSKAF